MTDAQPDILICGGTSRAGLDAARLLSSEGMRCIAAGRNPISDQDVKASKGRMIWEEVDFARPQSVDAFCSRIMANKSYDIGHCIFFQRSRSIDLLESIQVSIASSVAITEALQQPLKNHQGSIVFIGSVLGEKIGKEQTLAYHVSKGSVGPCVRYLAVKLGSSGIRVNSINLSTLMHSLNEKGYAPNTPLDSIVKKIIPIGRPTASADVVNMIRFLISPGATAVTGQEIHVDGGLNAMSQVSSAIQVME